MPLVCLGAVGQFPCTVFGAVGKGALVGGVGGRLSYCCSES